MPYCYVVLGTPRSGTSVTAGILHRLGVRMTLRDFVEATPANPTGFYEDPDLNAAISGTPVGRPLYLAEKYSLRQQMKRAILERCEAGVDWGCKTYRLPFVLDDFAQLCPMPVRLIFTQRDRSASKASWGRAFNGDAKFIDAVGDLVDAKKTISSFVVNYNQLVDSPTVSVQAIADFVGKPLTPEAVSFVDAALRNYP